MPLVIPTAAREIPEFDRPDEDATGQVVAGRHARLWEDRLKHFG